MSWRACARTGGGEADGAGGGLEQHGDGAKLDVGTDEVLDEGLAEPEDERLVDGTVAAVAGRAPGVGDFGADEDEVAVVIGLHVVADEALALAVEGEGELVLAVVVPLEGDGGQPAVEEGPGALLRGGDVFEVGLHGEVAGRIKLYAPEEM